MHKSIDLAATPVLTGLFSPYWPEVTMICVLMSQHSVITLRCMLGTFIVNFDLCLHSKHSLYSPAPPYPFPPPSSITILCHTPINIFAAAPHTKCARDLQLYSIYIANGYSKGIFPNTLHDG